MSLTYRPKNINAKGNSGENDRDFDANVSGCNILGYMSEFIGETTHTGFTARAPYAADKEKCVVMAEKLKKLTDSEYERCFDALSYCLGPDSTYRDLKTYINMWICFLQTCDGYKAF